ncbi:hypothetical protein RFI_22759 [Reticulomyxa filosa]|uniref:Uncharacterized protein n=1 Tax=Reticulomyxa filosa TaxID=46433 RepID=X6MNC3_RETFI|nr:hypothetical protein RFI_22759 [Reticulomyxa filosa]|eukprot:ETO14605.1 hypothetical protein RFI_22759 [Reticulomyxa filosa]
MLLIISVIVLGCLFATCGGLCVWYLCERRKLMRHKKEGGTDVIVTKLDALMEKHQQSANQEHGPMDQDKSQWSNQLPVDNVSIPSNEHLHQLLAQNDPAEKMDLIMEYDPSRPGVQLGLEPKKPASEDGSNNHESDNDVVVKYHPDTSNTPRSLAQNAFAFGANPQQNANEGYRRSTIDEPEGGYVETANTEVAFPSVVTATVISRENQQSQIDVGVSLFIESNLFIF